MKESKSSGDNNWILYDPLLDEYSVRRLGATPTSVTFDQGTGIFGGTASKIVYLAKRGVKSVRIKIALTTTTEDILKLSSSHNIVVSAGTITANGFSSPTIYVDGAATATVTTASKEIVVTTATAFTADDIQLGYVSSYLDGIVDLFGLNNTTLTASYISNLYNNKTYIELPDKISSTVSKLLDVHALNGIIQTKYADITNTDIVAHKEGGNVYSMYFDTAKGVFGNIGTIGSLNLILFYDGTDQDGIIDLDGGTNTVEHASGTLTYWGDNAYINGVDTDTLSMGVNYITIIDNTGTAASAFQIGYDDTNYFGGKIGRCTVYSGVESLAQHSQFRSSNKKYFR